jgi:uncharacterized RDD family membrane protein YckC
VTYPSPQTTPDAGQPAVAPSPEFYTSWVQRVLASIIDGLLPAVLTSIGFVFLLSMQQVDSICVGDAETGAPTTLCVGSDAGPTSQGLVLFGVFLLAGLSFAIWNHGFQQGRTGSSVGKALLKFKVVDETDWEPIGFGRSVVRQLAHFIDWVTCGIGYLWPLVDAKRQTFADKLLKTVCVAR